MTPTTRDMVEILRTNSQGSLKYLWRPDAEAIARRLEELEAYTSSADALMDAASLRIKELEAQNAELESELVNVREIFERENLELVKCEARNEELERKDVQAPGKRLTREQLWDYLSHAGIMFSKTLEITELVFGKERFGK